MSHDTVYTRTMRRAIEALGGPEQLARVLGASSAQIEAWAAGPERPPPGLFLRAIDIAARSAFGPRGAANS